MTYKTSLSNGIELKLYNGAIQFRKPLVMSEGASRMAVELTTDAKYVFFEVTKGALIHPGVVKPGVYVEFFHKDARGRREWQTPSLLGFETEADWNVDVAYTIDGFTVVFTPA